MKKLFAAIAAFALAATVASAQDFNAAVDAFNAGAQALETNKTEALAHFRTALTEALACEGEEAADLVAKCKEIIPGTLLSIAKEKINEGSYDDALVTLEEVKTVAAEYEAAEAAAEAENLIPNALMRKGTTLLKAKELDGAIEALTRAYDLGEEKAGKLLSTAYLQKGNALRAAGKNAEAIEALEKSNSYAESANAYKLIASVYTKSGKSAQAIDAYKKYLELEPNAKDAADIMFTIAATAQKAGDKATAKEYYKKLAGTKYAAQAEAQLKTL